MDLMSRLVKLCSSAHLMASKYFPTSIVRQIFGYSKAWQATLLVDDVDLGRLR